MTKFERRLRPRAFRLNGDQTVASTAAASAPQDDARKTAQVIEPDEDAFAAEVAELTGVSGDEAAVEAAQIDGLLRRYMLS